MSQKDRVSSISNYPIAKEKEFVVYWCHHSLRSAQNHSLEYAIHLANSHNVALVVCTCIDTSKNVSERHLYFELQAKQSLANTLAARGIGCLHIFGNIPAILHYISLEAVAIVIDKGYLKDDRKIIEEIKSQCTCAVIMVESNVVVPIESASSKQEHAAYTIRAKIKNIMNNYLVKINEQNLQVPSVECTHTHTHLSQISQASPYIHNYRNEVFPITTCYTEHLTQTQFINLHIPHLDTSIGKIEEEVHEVRAKQSLEYFFSHHFVDYNELARDPCVNNCQGICSKISHYLRLGIISPVQVVLMLDEFIQQQSDTSEEGLQKLYASYEKYTDELIIRRELAYNYCYYNPYYDTYQGLPSWAHTTLKDHLEDPRDYEYDLKSLEEARTYDPYWNAAQSQLKKSGHMHGYMRMYWGKKILEWSHRPQDAFEHALYLNNKYALDAPDPNSYVGVAWCFGTHDRPHPQRAIFGTLRYMNANGLRRKFKQIEAYCTTWL